VLLVAVLVGGLRGLLLLHGDLQVVLVEETHLALFHRDDEDGVGTARHVVHLGGGGRSVVAAGLHQLLDLRGGAHCPLGEVVHLDPEFLVLPDLQPDVGGFEQVTDVLVVDLQEGGTHELALVLVAALLDEVEDFFQTAADQALVLVVRFLVEAVQGVGLAAARLALCDHGRVVAVEDALDCVAPADGLDLFLRAVGCVHVVVGELGLGVDLGFGGLTLHVGLDQLLYGEGLEVGVDFDVVLLKRTEFLEFSFDCGPHSYDHFKIIFIIQILIVST